MIDTVDVPGFGGMTPVELAAFKNGAAWMSGKEEGERHRLNTEILRLRGWLEWMDRMGVYSQGCFTKALNGKPVPE